MFYDKLAKILKEENILTDEPLSNHSTFKIGGKCDFVVFPENENELIEILILCKKEKIMYYIVGNGSNILFSDDRHKCVVIRMTHLNNITVSGNEITAYCGAKLSAVCTSAWENSLTKMEPLNGIPGTVGGAVYMNAGAYGGEIKDVCIKTFYLDEDFSIKEINSAEHEFSYRHSFFSDKNYIIIKSVFRLEKGNKDEIKEKMADFIERRNSKQPLNYPNAGSTFKRPEGYFAGKLIEDCNLKGYCCGGACVSEKHSGFVINKKNATAKDVCSLINYIQKTVKEKFNVDLKTEIKFF